MARIAVKVHARARRSAVTGRLGEVWKVSLAAPLRADGSSHDWLDDAIAFDVMDTRVAAGVANLRAEVEWRVSR